MSVTTIVNQLLSLLTVFGQLIVAAILVSFFIKHKQALKYLKRRGILFAWIIALTATFGSLFYSEVAGYNPCKLCWFQRVLMYPQAIILGLGLKYKDKNVWRYALGLSIPGAVIAGYHYLLQIGLLPSLVCDAVGYSVSCSQRFVMTFGYVTIPLMAFTAFVMIILFAFLSKIKA